MSGDEMDSWLHRQVPPVEITDARLQALIQRTMRQARTEPRSRGIGAWLRWPRLMPVMHYALPMLVAAILGVTVSSGYANDLPVAQFSSLMLSTTLMPSGS